MSEYIDYEELKAAAMEKLGATAPEIAEFQEMDAADGDSLPFWKLGLVLPPALIRDTTIVPQGVQA